MGRADHPWSAAVERGRSTLPKNQLGQHAVLPLLSAKQKGRPEPPFSFILTSALNFLFLLLAATDCSGSQSQRADCEAVGRRLGYRGERDIAAD